MLDKLTEWGLKLVRRFGLFWGAFVIGLIAVPPSMILAWLMALAYVPPERHLVVLVMAAVVPALVGPPVGLFQLFLVRQVDRAEQEKSRLVDELSEALAEVRELKGLLPICAECKDVRDDKGYWHAVETFVADHSRAEFSHGFCPNCVKTLYPELAEQSAAGEAATS